MNHEFDSVPQLYQVNVVILEGRHLGLTNANTKVKVSIGKRKKTIHAKNNRTDCPYYNDFCVFLFRLPLSVLLDEILTIKVFQKSINTKLVGSFSVELTTVWSQPDHQFYHKWAVLVDPKNPTSGVKGFLKCDIGILEKGVLVKPTKPQESESNLEKNLLVPYGGTKDRLKTRIVLSIFRADGFSPYFTGKLRLFKPYIKITYRGDVRKTSIAKNKGPPVWNEELSFLDLFPPLTQNMLIEIFDLQRSSRKSLGNTNIDIGSLYEDGKDGFLPTFGPNFLYLYHPFKKFQRHRNCCTLQNSFTYMGRLLLSLRTEVIDNFASEVVQKKSHKTVPKPIPPLIEKVYFEYNKFILFAAIFDALLFDAKYAERNINIRVTLGPKKNPSEAKIKTKVKKKRLPKNVATLASEKEPLKHLTVINECNTTSKQRCYIKDDYTFKTFSGKFPCIHVFGEWPDSLKRMYCSNIIKKVIQNCTNEVKKIKYDLQFESEKRSESSQKLKATLADLSKSCEVILLLTNVTKLEDTNLCRQRKKVYHREIAEIALQTKIASNQNALKAEDELRKISTYLARLTKYAQDPENSFPDTEIWLLRNNKTVAQYRIRTEDVAFSKDFNNRGIMSGKTQTILFRGKRGKVKAKLDIFVWFGLADNFVECLKMLPGGLQKSHPPCPSSSGLKIPGELVYDEEHHFQCRAHIFQGKIFVGFENEDLVDPFVRIIILGQNKKTRIRKATLSPIWDETLVFPLVTLYGPSSYLKENPVTVTVELFDYDRFAKPELIGRSFVRPLIKLKDEKYGPPHFPPKLIWEDFNFKYNHVGKVLMAMELLELSDDINNLTAITSSGKSTPISVPENIRPHNVKYRLEIVFWGVRQLRRKRCLRNKVLVTLETGNNKIKSPILHNVRDKLNFPPSVQFLELELPEEPEFAPPFSLRLFHILSMTGKKTYVATCIIPSIRSLYKSFRSTAEKPREKKVRFPKLKLGIKKEQEKGEKKKTTKWLEKFKRVHDLWEKILFSGVLYRFFKCKLFKKCGESTRDVKLVPEEEKLSWWMKYHASREESSEYSGIPPLRVYLEELEAQPEFKGFQDFLQTFNMITDQENKTKGRVLMAKVKAAIKLYRWPPENSETKVLDKIKSNEGLLSKAFTNTPLKFVVRVYVICAKNLASRDVYGKSDPYLFVQLGHQSINDRRHYIPKQLNPTFGKCFELKGTFPYDHLLRIKVIDYDARSKDDLIGETTIDIENRYYSKHHATCGIASTFVKKGVSFWRDIYMPTDILKMLCKQLNLQPPVYENHRVLIEGHEFATAIPETANDKEEIQALMVLNRWHEMPVYGFHLVPEHVETRSLYHPSIPGIEQGKLVLWIDIFPADFKHMPPKVDVTPQPPVAMELRAIVWNVVDVVLEDRSVLVNGKLSDIYVKGWILSLEEEMQKTDIHYRSVNGEGNFNWRFIFHFKYIPVERIMTVKKKVNAFDTNPEEKKVQCKLEIQVWDNDAFGDDSLGTLILELCSMPRGAKLSSRCTLKMLAPNAVKVNLFKIKKIRGWWPFRRPKMKETVDKEFELTGKIDLELEILTETEAIQFPAGKGREEPNALPPPQRPESSFNRWLNPLKTFRRISWKRIAKKLFIGVLILLLVFFVLIVLIKKMRRA